MRIPIMVQATEIKITNRQVTRLSRTLKTIMAITPIKIIGSIASNRIQASGLIKTVKHQRIIQKISTTSTKKEFLVFKQPANAAGCCVLRKYQFFKTPQSAFCYLANLTKYFCDFFLHRMCSFKKEKWEKLF